MRCPKPGQHPCVPIAGDRLSHTDAGPQVRCIPFADAPAPFGTQVGEDHSGSRPAGKLLRVPYSRVERRARPGPVVLARPERLSPARLDADSRDPGADWLLIQQPFSMRRRPSGWYGLRRLRMPIGCVSPREIMRDLARLRQLGLLTDDNLLIFRDRTPKGRHYTERRGAPPTRLQDSSFGAGCFGNAKSS